MSPAGDLRLILSALADRVRRARPAPTTPTGSTQLRAGRGGRPGGRAWPSSRPTPTRSSPAGSTASCARCSTADAVTIGDGGDFVSYAGRYLEPAQPGTWLDPGPYGCLGTGMGYAMGARVTYPDRQICVLMGDGAAGFSLMDVESLVRQKLPVVIVVGNNGIWGLEKHPMQAMYGYDVAADLQPGLRYDEVVERPGRRRRDGREGRRARPGAAAGLRRRRAVPGQRAHRPGRRVPPLVQPGVEDC